MTSSASSSPKLSTSNSFSNLKSTGISVPSRPSGHIRKDSSSGSGAESTTQSQSQSQASKDHAASSGFTPGGAVPAGYSYLTRSHSLVTATRSRPRGMDVQSQSTGAKKEIGNSSMPRSATTDSFLSGQVQSHSSSTSRPLPPIPTSQSSSSVSKQGSNSPSPLPSPSLSQGPPPRRSKTLHYLPSNSNEESGLNRSKTDAETLEALVSQLPPNPKHWTPSQVALYLSHVLGLTPRPIVEDVTAYVRNSRMGGKVFLRLREEDLEKEGLNLKWRGLMMEAVRKLRRNCLRGRIWGFQGSAGGVWPRTLEDEEEISAPHDLEGHIPEEQDENPEAKTNNKGTLKRLRERRRVRGMIQALDSATENGNEDEEDGFVALGHGGSRSGSGSGSFSASFEHQQQGSGGSPRQQMAPIYGHGFVKERAASFTSVSDLETEDQPQNRPTRKIEISPAELEEWFGTLSEQEAASLASELEDDDLHGFGDTESESESLDHGEVEKVEEEAEEVAASTSHNRALNTSAGNSSIGSSLSVEGPQTPPPVYTSMGEQSMKELLLQSEASPSTQKQESSTQKLGLFLDGNESTGISTARPRRGDAPRNTSNPYRASTYTPEELASLPVDEDAVPRFGTARRIPLIASTSVTESLAQAVADPELGAEADIESEEEDGVTMRRPRSSKEVPSEKSINDLFPPQTYPSARDLFDAPSPPRRAVSGEKPEMEIVDDEIPPRNIESVPISTASPSPNHMRNMSQHVASGTSPYAPLGRRSSQKKASNSSISSGEGDSPIASSSRVTESGVQRTLGSKRATQLAALLRAGGVDEETGNPLGAEEEGNGAWGGTLSRSVSRKTGGGGISSIMPSSTSSSSSSSNTPNKGAAKMLELFSPAKEVSDPILENQVEEQIQDTATFETNFSQEKETVPVIKEPELSSVDENSALEIIPEKLTLIEEEIEAQQEILNVAVAEAAKAEESGSGLKVRLPMTTLVPSPDGKGSVKKRSMVLVDRARFESLARRMGMLEEQLAALENASEASSIVGTSSSSSSSSRDLTKTKLSELFNSKLNENSQNQDSISSSKSRNLREIQTQTSQIENESSSTQTSTSSSTSIKTYVETSAGNDEEEELSEAEGWGPFSLGNPKLSLGAIPAYCLGLGAGVGFIILTEVVQRVARR